MTEEYVDAFRGTVRAILYEQHKYDLGCPTEEKCSLFRDCGGLKACELCPKHLKILPPKIKAEFSDRIKYVLRLENMVNVGCKFSPNDLSPSTWSQLITLAQERMWIQSKIDKQRRDADKEHPIYGSAASLEAQKLIDKQRSEQGIPPPGQPIFK